jgi:tetratricopeptide (TPR) repeat protein
VTQAADQPISPPVFLDVPVLLETSRPVRRVNWFSGAMFILALPIIFNLFVKPENDSEATLLHVMIGFMMLVTVVGSVIWSVISVRRLRAQQQTVDAIEEMMQLRRWEPAGILLDRFLSSPVRTPHLWAAALVRLAELLGRHHRFEDAILVQNFIIDNELLDDQSDYFMRLGRAMAMLREDHLVDADRAIGDLRRRGPEGGSGALALVEMFRDVKTGHPDEAIEIFGKFLPSMRQQLGHRVADAHALVARAYDLLGDESQAKAAYERATLLQPVAELQRRYPEVLKLAEKFQPAVAPKEAA